MYNCVAQTDAAGNVKASKEKSQQKIDPCVALIMAVGRAMMSCDETDLFDQFINSIND